MSVEQLKAGRRRPVPTPRSHEDIYDLVARALEAAELAGAKADDAAGRTDLMHGATQRVETKLDALITTVGTLTKVVGSESEDERGAKIGTGVVGRLMRLEIQVAKRFGLYDRWLQLAMGFAAAVSVAAAVIWWLIRERVDHILK